MHTQEGITLIEVLVSMTIMVIVSSALYLAYSNTLDIVSASQYHSAAANLIESEIEVVRNMDYEDIGTVGGVPSGKLLASKSTVLDETEFLIKTFVRNIDDPFDGILGGAPNDTAPADYKLVEIQIECNTCLRFGLIRSTTTVAPRNLESADGSGNLFIQVIDADGFDLSGASVTVVNAGVTPPVNLTDVTGANGMLQLVGVPTSSAGYEVTVTKAGHSTEQTYLPGEPSNPNPVKPHLTVAQEQLTISTFAIDLASAMTIRAIDQVCAPVSDVDLLLTGSKLIGTSPDVLKYSAGHTTAADGTVVVSDLEWDSYSLLSTDTTYEISGMDALSPVIVNPGDALNVDWVVVPKSASALLVTVTDDQGQQLNDASVRLEGSGYDITRMSGRFSWLQTDWSGGQYTAQSGGINTSTAGILTLAPDGGPYATASFQWLESDTIDMTGPGTTLFSISWNPSSQPPATGTDSVRFQVAGNNDNITWNYVGPDGTSGTYFTAPGGTIPPGISGNQFIRYRVEMKTDDPLTTTSVEDVSIEYNAACLPSGGAHFNGLSTGTYTVTVTKSGFQGFSDPDVQVNADWQNYNVQLTP
jgi:prepilin-type N-terminal cleavage/methylation domain-containing protein